MKKNLWIWALAALSMTACTSEDAPSQDQVVTENDFESPDGRVVVQLGAENSASVSVSRAIGPVEGENIIALTELGIFAIDRNVDLTQSETINRITTEWGDWPNTIDYCLLKNVKAQGAKTAETGFDKDNADDNTVAPLDPKVNTGKRITLYDTNASTPGAVYYYPIQGSHMYNFYGYHPRQDDGNITLENGVPRVSIALDGNVDLITGIAQPAPTVDEGDIYVTEHSEASNGELVSPKKGTSGVDIDGYNAKYIRKIKYSNWIIDKWDDEQTDDNLKLAADKKPFVPMISFGHRLTRLKFQIITAKEQAGEGDQSDSPGGDREDATELRVRNVKLMNAHTVARLYIQPDMRLEYIERTESGMNMIKDNTDETDVWVDADYIKPQAYNDNPDHEYITAGYLMVPATNQISDYAAAPYKIALTVVSKDSQGVPQSQDIVLDLKDKNKNQLAFLPGKSYNIRIALYALQEVNVSAELTPWDDDTENVYLPVE